MLSSVSPDFVPIGSGSLTLTLTGSGFTAASTVRINGTSITIPSTFIDATTLRVPVDKSFLANAGTITLAVVNPQSAASSPVSLAIGTPAPQFTPADVVNAASFHGGTVAPGEIVTFFGTVLGPMGLTGLALDSTNRVSTQLAGTRVLFDGIPAPLIYTSATQVSAVVPFAISGQLSTTVQIEFQGQRSAPIQIPVTTAAPALFTANSSGQGQAAALNQDGTVNSARNPAPLGSVMVLYGTGAGATDPPSVDGTLTTAPLSRLVQPVSVQIDGQPAEVLYAGPAPGLVAGVLQVNVRVPADTLSGNRPVLLEVGSAASQITTAVAVQ